MSKTEQTTTLAPPPSLAPSDTPAAGSLIALLGAAAQLGPVSGVQLGGQHAVVVTGAEEVRQVLVTDAARYTKQSHRARTLLGDGLITATGEPWKRQRRQLQPHFTGVGIRRYDQHIAEAAQHIARRWSARAASGEPVDVGEDMRYFALDTIWRLLTGGPLDARTHMELRALDTVVSALPTTGASRTGADGTGDTDTDAALALIDSAAHRVINTARRELRDTRTAPGTRETPGAAEAETAEAETETETATAAADAAGDAARDAARDAAGETHAPGTHPVPTGAPARGGLLHELLDLSRAPHTPPAYTDQLIRDELVTLIVAGHETTATTLAWLQLLLHQHPEWRIWALRSGQPGSPERQAAYQALISETLRLYPAIWLLPRHTTGPAELGGHRVEGGTRVLVCPYLTHRDPALWPDPGTFDPRRFTEGTRPPHGAYHPFGTGARACLGQQFALREMELLLEALLPHFAPAFDSPPPLTDPVFAATLHPDGPMAATIRSSPFPHPTAGTH